MDKEILAIDDLGTEPREIIEYDNVLSPIIDLAIIDRNMKSVVEPGDFDIMVGGSSDNLPLRGVLTVE